MNDAEDQMRSYLKTKTLAWLHQEVKENIYKKEKFEKHMDWLKKVDR